MRCAFALVVAFLLAAGPAAQEPAPAELMARVGRYAEEYFRRVARLLSRETIRLQRLDGALAPRDEARILIYELRIESGEDALLPRMTRRLMKASGHILPMLSDDQCYDPPDASIEPLAMLLPERQAEFVFSVRKSSSDGTIEIDFAPALRRDPVVNWAGVCGMIDVSGSTRGRLWVDGATGAVVRADERLDRPFTFRPPPSAGAGVSEAQTVDALETSIRYEPVTFRNPDEVLILPKTARTLTRIYNGAVPRLMTLQSFDKYQRFTTGGRLVK